MKVIKKLLVQNEMGLHTRPATVIVKMLQHVQSEVFFTWNKNRINAKSIFGILTLAAGKNTLLTVECEGIDAEETMRKLEEGFSRSFGEKN